MHHGKTLILLAAVAAAASAFPALSVEDDDGGKSKGFTVAKTKPGLRHKSEELARRLELLSPEDNLVEPDPVKLEDSLAAPQPPVSQDSSEEDAAVPSAPVAAGAFPDRPAGFATGHRIPVELFGRETRARLQQEDEDGGSSGAGRSYVDSSAFRAATASSYPPPSRLLQPPPAAGADPPYPEPPREMFPPPVLASHRVVDPHHPPPSGSASDPARLVAPPRPFALEGGLLSAEKDPTYFGHLDAFVPDYFLE